VADAGISCAPRKKQNESWIEIQQHVYQGGALMRRFNLAVALFAAVLVTASGALANIPDPVHCEVGDVLLINTDPYDHEYGLTAAERYQDVVVTLYTESMVPVVDFPAGMFTFSVVAHPDYPHLGAGSSGGCPSCLDHYSVTCQDAMTNALGEMVVRVSVGHDCAPSFTCPVHITVTLDGFGDIPTPIEVLQNSFDLIPNGDVRGPDFASFSTAYNNWTSGSTLAEDADFVWVLTPVPQSSWGEVSGPDFSAFATAYKDCCGFPKEDDPANCETFTNPCP
jgi:hypothetical protein